jgi:hypothetical protein
MSVDRKELLRHRRALYFDCIMGSGIAIFSLTLLFMGIGNIQIANIASYLFSIVFWIFILGLGVFIIAIGLYGFYLEKKYPNGVPTKKKIRAPKIG